MKSFIWIPTLLLLFYSFSVYHSFFETKNAYIYVPKSDRVFLVKLAPVFSECDRWAPLIPFRRCEGSVIVDVEYLWKLDQKLQDIKFEKEQIHAYIDKVKKDTDALLDKGAGITDEQKDRSSLTFWNIEYYPNWTLSVDALLPNALSPLKVAENQGGKGIFPVNLAIFKSGLGKKSAEIELLEGVFFRDEGAKEFVKVIDDRKISLSER